MNSSPREQEDQSVEIRRKAFTVLEGVARLVEEESSAGANAPYVLRLRAIAEELLPKDQRDTRDPLAAAEYTSDLRHILKIKDKKMAEFLDSWPEPSSEPDA